MPADATVTIVDTGPPAPPPKPTSTINVAPVPAAAGTPPPPPKPGSARERMFADLEKRAKGPTDPSGPSRRPAPQPKGTPSTQEPTEPPVPEPEPEGNEPVDEPGSSADQPGEPAQGQKPKPATAPKTGEKKNPWKMMEEWKAKATQLESELLETRKGAIPKEQREKETKEFESVRSRNKELEDEIRFVNYSKSKEYLDNFEKPYDEAWHRAMDELSEVSLDDPNTGEKRAMTPNDLLELVNKPLSEAMQDAQDKYGPLAPEVMAYRKEIRKLFDAKAKALEQARTVSAERDKQQREYVTKFQQELNDKVNEYWSKASETLVNDQKYGKYFQPVEGDENINQRLAKGFQLVDRAMRENPRDPNLTAEQRKGIVDRHAALRFRAAAFGRVFYELGQALEKITSLEEKLTSYEQTEPSTEGGGAAPNTNGMPTKARDQVMAALFARAK